MAADGPVDANRSGGELTAGLPGMVAKPPVEDARILPGRARQHSHAPAEPGGSPPRGCRFAGQRGERMLLGKALEERKAEQVALSLVDRDGEVIVERIAQRVAHEKCPAPVHPQGIDRRLADALAGHHLGRDRLPLAALARIDRRRPPGSERIAGHDRRRDPAQPALHQLPRANRLLPGDPPRRMVGGLREEQPQRAGGLGGERHPAAIQPVPDDPHRVGRAAGIKHVGRVDVKRGELERGVVGMLEWMQRIAAQPKGRRVGLGQPHNHHRRPAIEHGQQLHQPPVGRPRDEHLGAGEQETVGTPLERRPHPS